MGQPTFGKGSVQNVIDLKNRHSLKLTTARYYTPSGASIQARGITPDIVLQNVTVSEQPASNRSVSEKNLSGHLEGDKEDQSERNRSERSRKLAKDDYPLFEALSVLKGVGLYTARS
jgi:carboxyl-terminal processing protease